MNNNKSIITTKDGKPFEVTALGSLGLLALGHIGLNAWRDERKKLHSSSKQQNLDSTS